MPTTSEVRLMRCDNCAHPAYEHNPEARVHTPWSVGSECKYSRSESGTEIKLGCPGHYRLVTTEEIATFGKEWI